MICILFVKYLCGCKNGGVKVDDNAEVKKKPKLSNNKKRKIERLANDAKLAFNNGDLVLAEACCQKILQIDADNGDAYLVMGSIVERMGDLQRAKSLFEYGLQKKTGHRMLLAKCGEINCKLQQFVNAEQFWNHYTTLYPGDVAGWHSLSGTMIALQRWESAIPAAKEAVRLAPKRAELHKNLGVALYMGNHEDEAEEAYGNAVMLAPQCVDSRCDLAKILMERGEMDEAREHFHKLIELDPKHAIAYHSLMRFWQVKEYDDLIKGAEALCESAELSSEARIMLSFGLGKAWEDLKDYDKSFGYYELGNKLYREGISYDVEDDRRDVEEIKQLFTREMLDERCSGRNDGAGLIFIVGMPRSGSTLLDRIISAHPKVIDTGEHDFFRKAAGVLSSDNSGRMNLIKLIEQSDEAITAAAKSHIENIRRNFGAAEYYTDKALPNIWLIGAIRLILPGAKIIHCSRNPLDNCLSIFAHNFEGTLFKYGYDLRELGAYYRVYLDMINHWQKVLPSDAYYNISYEALVADPEEQTRRIIAFSGLEWDDNCLSFYKQNSRVRSASLAQVRQPINKASVERWKRFEQQLQPLVDALGEAVEHS